MPLLYKEKPDIFSNYFIKYCLEEIEIHRKISGGISIANEASNMQKILDSSSRIPVIGTLVSMAILFDQLYRNMIEYGATERITKIFPAECDRQTTEILLRAAIQIANGLTEIFNKTDDSQAIINLAAFAKNKLFTYLKTNKFEEQLTTDIIVNIISKQSSWFSKDIFSIYNDNNNNLVSNDILVIEEKHELDSLAPSLDMSLKKRKRDNSLSNYDNKIHDNYGSADKVLNFNNSYQELLYENDYKIQTDHDELFETRQQKISKRQYFYNMPEAVNCFAGRVEQLNLIHEYFLKNYNGIQVIGGLGGIGKTQTALKYTKEYKQEYTHRVRFLSAGSKDSLDLAFRNFAQELDIITDNKSNEEIVKLVKNLLSKQIEHSLLVFDNVTDFELITNYLPDPGGIKQHHVIITTQDTKDYEDSASITGMNIIKLNQFNQYESIEFITKSIKDCTIEEALTLAELFDNIPLALSQSISYIIINNISIDIYLSEYQRFRNENPLQLPNLHSKKFDQHKENIYTTIYMTLFKLGQTEPNALKLLQICSYLSSNNIPDYLFDDVFANYIEKSRLISVLEGYSLISVSKEKDKSFIYMHQLLQEITKVKAINEFQAIVTKTIKLVHKQINKDDNINKVIDLDKYQLLLQHALSLIKYCDIYSFYLNDHDNNALKNVLAELHNDCGNIYFILLQLDSSKKYYTKALEIYESTDSKQKIATVLSNIGAINQVLGNLEESLAIYKQALDMSINLYSSNHRRVAFMYSKIGHAELTSGRIDESLINYYQALQIYANIQDKGNTAGTTQSIGNVYCISQKYSEALEKYQMTLAINIDVYGDKSLQSAETEHAIGKLFLACGRSDDALKQFNKALEINRNILGDRHYIIAKNIRGICKTFQALGENEKAIELYKEVIDIFMGSFGEEHLLVGNSMCAIGNLYQLQEKYQEALLYYNQALKIYKDTYGEEYFNVAKILNQIGNINNKLGQTEVGSQQLLRAESIKSQSLITSQTSQMSDFIWMGLVEDIEESQKSQMSSQDYDITDSRFDIKVLYLTDIQYNNPLLNFITIANKVDITINGKKILTDLIALGNDQEIVEIILEAIKEYGLDHVINIIFAGNSQASYHLNDKEIYDEINIYSKVMGSKVIHDKIIEQNFFLNSGKARDFIQVVTSNFDEEILLAILELGIDKDIVEQILFESKTQGINKVISTLLSKEVLVQKTTGNIENVIGIEELNRLQIVPNGILNSWSGKVYHKLANYIDNLANNLDNMLNIGKSCNQVAITITLLEEWLSFAASGQRFVGVPPHYDPNKDNFPYDGGDDSYDGNNGHNNTSNGFSNVILALYNETDYNVTDYQM